MRSTSDKTAPLSLHGTDRWEIIPAFPRVREAPACFPYGGTPLPEKQTLKQPPRHTLWCWNLPFLPTWEYSQYIINSHCRNLQTDGANETHFRGVNFKTCSQFDRPLWRWFTFDIIYREQQQIGSERLSNHMWCRRREDRDGAETCHTHTSLSQSLVQSDSFWWPFSQLGKQECVCVCEARQRDVMYYINNRFTPTPQPTWQC